MNNNKQLSRLMVFTTVAQKKSFTQAAKHLQISKSAVSQQVTLLESELGVSLLNRTTREISLTAIGSTLLERCTILQDQLSLVFNDLAQAGISPRGKFAVTYPHSLEREVILPAIEQLCCEYPNLEPTLIADDSSLDLVEEQLDLAIHIGELADSNYRALPIGSLTELFCAAPSYVNRHGEITSIEQLQQHRWISAPWQRCTTKVSHSRSNKEEDVKLNEFAKANTLPAAIGMASRGLGIVLVPDVIAHSLFRSGQLLHIADNLKGPEWPVYSIHAYQQEKPVHVTRFHQLICRRFNQVNEANL